MAWRDFFAPRGSPVFGLDISARSLKVAQLQRRGKGYFVRSIGRSQPPAGIIRRGRILDQARLAGEIRKLLAQTDGAPITSRFVIASLPEEESFLRVVEVAPEPGQGLNDLIRKESEANIPVYLDEVYLDWQPLAARQDSEPRRHLLIVAVRKAVVDAYVATLKLAGLFPVALETESISIARALMANNASTSPVLIVDLGADRTTLIVYSEGSVRYTVPIEFESEELTGAIAEALKLPEKEAERYKKKYGLDATQHKGDVVRALQPLLHVLIDQIQRHVDFYNTHPAHEHAAVKISGVVLSGGGAALPNIDGYLEKALGLPVSVGNPWTNILNSPLPQLMVATKHHATHFTTSLGLALRGVTTDIYD